MHPCNLMQWSLELELQSLAHAKRCVKDGEDLIDSNVARHSHRSTVNGM